MNSADSSRPDLSSKVTAGFWNRLNRGERDNRAFSDRAGGSLVPQPKAGISCLWQEPLAHTGVTGLLQSFAGRLNLKQGAALGFLSWLCTQPPRPQLSAPSPQEQATLGTANEQDNAVCKNLFNKYTSQKYQNNYQQNTPYTTFTGG